MKKRISYLLTGVIVSSTFFFGGCGAGDGSEFSAVPYEQIDGEGGESWVTFNAAGTRVVFGRHDENWSSHSLWEGVLEGGQVQGAERMTFSGRYNDRAARFYPALDAMLFSSDRPLSEADTTDDFNLWIVQFDGEEWTDPQPMSALNTSANEIHPSVAADGSIWFASDREESLGGSDLFVATLGANGYEVRHVQAPVNSERSEADVFIDPEQRYLVFARTDDPAGLGGDDLYISISESGQWGNPQHLGAAVNTDKYEYGPWVSRDETTLYFTSHTGGTAGVYRIPVTELPIEWPAR